MPDKEYRSVPVVAGGDDPVGGQLSVARATLAYTDTTAKTLFTLPAGAIIVDWILNVTTAFNDSGTDQVNIGITGTAAKFASALDVSSAGLKTTGVVAAEIGAVQAAATPVLGIFAGQNANASAGAMTIMALYYVP